jgi:orotidine-5'-phosphate decarboxylase
MRGKKGLILAADVLDKERLLDVVRQTAPYIDAVKVGNWVLYQHGWSLIGDIKRVCAVPVIADLKLMDFPGMAKRITASAVSAGADGLMVCGIIGQPAVELCRQEAKGRLVFVFTEFTHQSGMISESVADQCVDVALATGCDGVQVPATRPERVKSVRRKVGQRLLIISCGVGSQVYCGQEGRRPDFGSAVAAGADYEIVGRAIYDSVADSAPPAELARRAKERILASCGENPGH